MLNRPTSFILTTIFSLLLTLSASGAETFVQSEFPNYLRVDDLSIDASIQLWSRALQSIYKRLEVPIMVDGKPEMVRYFSFLTTELQKIDANVEILPSGGVVRSAISQIYSIIYNRKRNDKSLKVATILNEIINGEESVSAMDIRGVASDFDVLLRNYSPRNIFALKNRGTKITESPEVTYGARYSRDEKKRAVFLIPDFKDYAEQTARSTAQGGSEIDFLGFSIKNGEFIEPENNKGIIQRMFSGYFRYLPSQASSGIEDPNKQTVRGLRPLIELPFLKVEDDTQLRSEIQKLVDKVKSGTALSDKAILQFSKTVRNARFSGAHNRFYRGAPGSVEQLVFELVSTIKKSTRSVMIPEFVDEFEIGRTPVSILPNEFFMPLQEFISTYTDSGTLYHGTPDFMMGLSILRGGLFISGGINSQGTSLKGRGGYSSKNIMAARFMAGDKGLIIRLKVSSSLPLRIIDWQKVKDSPEVLKIQSQNPSRDIFEVLARDYGVDIVINDHVLIENINAVVFPQSLSDIIHMMHESLLSTLSKDRSSAFSDLQAFKEYNNYHSYGLAIGLRDLPELPDITNLAIDAIHKFDRFGRSSYFKLLMDVCEVSDCSEIKDYLPEPLAALSELQQSALNSASKYITIAEREYGLILRALRFYRGLGIEFPGYSDQGDLLKEEIQKSPRYSSVQRSTAGIVVKISATQSTIQREFNYSKDQKVLFYLNRLVDGKSTAGVDISDLIENLKSNPEASQNVARFISQISAEKIEQIQKISAAAVLISASYMTVHAQSSLSTRVTVNSSPLLTKFKSLAWSEFAKRNKHSMNGSAFFFGYGHVMQATPVSFRHKLQEYLVFGADESGHRIFNELLAVEIQSMEKENLSPAIADWLSSECRKLMN